MINHSNDENLRWKIILSLPHVPASIIGHFEDKICETLDLMTEMNLCWLKDQNRTVNDFKIDFDE